MKNSCLCHYPPSLPRCILETHLLEPSLTIQFKMDAMRLLSEILHVCAINENEHVVIFFQEKELIHRRSISLSFVKSQ